MSIIVSRQRSETGRATVVLDVGKTVSKLSLWAEDGQVIAECHRTNERIETGQYRALDSPGIKAFLCRGLQRFAALAEVCAVIPVGHGAAMAVVDGSDPVQPPMDYEQPIPASVRHAYDPQRDSFVVTGSPALPDGLNLGAQLHFLETLQPDLLSGKRRILPWAQYWSWVLSGIAASEVTSLGCHTDLWWPFARAPSALAIRRGWTERLAPLQHAGAVLGTLSREWTDSTRLSPTVRVHCGLHDSNAALLAARAFAEIAEHDATVLSTGTWFVAMRSPGQYEFDISGFDERRDCLVNVDITGSPVPSARFMGGREIEILTGHDTPRIDIRANQRTLLSQIDDVLASDAMVLPAFTPGCGPFPRSRGRWIARPENEASRCIAIALYAALVADVTLDLIGARDRLLIEGRFSESEVLVRALAGLRPDTQVYVCRTRTDASFGAVHVIHPQLQPSSALQRVEPLPTDLADYRRRWRCAVGWGEHPVA